MAVGRILEAKKVYDSELNEEVTIFDIELLC